MPLRYIHNDCKKPHRKQDETELYDNPSALLAAYESTGLKPHEIINLQSELAAVKAQRDLAINDLHINTKCSICQNIPFDGNMTHCVHYAECGLAYTHFKWRGEQTTNQKIKE